MTLSKSHTDLLARLFLMAVILLFAFWLRINTFWQPHWQGDQSQYVTLAMKLNEKGLNGYNMSEAEIHSRDIAGSKEWYLSYATYEKGKLGDFHKAYDRFGLSSFNEMPLYYKAPLFPAALTLSHKLLTEPGMPYVVANIRKGFFPGNFRNSTLFKVQFWAVVVPLLSSLLVILFTFLYTHKFFGGWAAVMAAFLLAIHPISIVTSQKILSDEFTSLFMLVALFAFLAAYEKKSLIGCLFAGMAGGLAVLARQNAGLCVLTVWFYTILTCDDAPFKGHRSLASKLLNPYFIFFMLGLFFICLHWFMRVYSVYVTPLYEPNIYKKIMEDRTGWFDLLNKRPHAAILFAVGIPYLCPPFVFAYASLKTFFVQLKDRIFRKATDTKILFLWFWILPFYIFFMGRIESKEHRYMLMVYPALAILSAIHLEKFYVWLKKKCGLPKIFIAHGVMMGFIFLSTVWSVSLARETISKGMFLIHKPF